MILSRSSKRSSHRSGVKPSASGGSNGRWPCAPDERHDSANPGYFPRRCQLPARAGRVSRADTVRQNAGSYPTSGRRSPSPVPLPRDCRRHSRTRLSSKWTPRHTGSFRGEEWLVSATAAHVHREVATAFYRVVKPRQPGWSRRFFFRIVMRLTRKPAGKRLLFALRRG